MSNLTYEEMEERLRIAGDIVRSGLPAGAGERQEWIDGLREIADEMEYVADTRESEFKTQEVNWPDLSYPDRLRAIAKQARTAAESFSKPAHQRSLEEQLYPGGE